MIKYITVLLICTPLLMQAADIGELENKNIVLERHRHRYEVNPEFVDVLEKTKELKNTLSDFIESLGVTVSQVGNIISYAFLIPIIPMLISIHVDNNTDTSMVVGKIIKSLLSSGGVALSANLLRVLLNKIVDRIRQN